MDGSLSTSLIAKNAVRIGSQTIDERALNARLDVVRRSIKAWAKSRQLWFDASFHTPYLHNDECPGPGDVLYLTFEGPLHGIFGSGFDSRASKYAEQLLELLADLGFAYDMQDHVTMTIFPTDEHARDEYLSLYRWQWLQRLAERRLFDIHVEVFEYFAKHPDRLGRLGWRQFEEFLDSVFRNQGFYTELGPGSHDGGVDLRVYQSQSVPELVTVVQAKRYTNRPVGLEAVAALFGIAVEQRATRGIVATTSRFLPQAKKFALSTQRRLDVPSIELADSQRVGEWCAEIAQQLNNFFARGTTTPKLLDNQTTTRLSDSIVVATGGYNITENYFAIIEFDFQHEVILRPIGREIVSGDFQVGCEMPKEGAPFWWTEASRLVAFKSRSEFSGREYFWGNRKLFSPWDGTPQSFNSMD
jgi:hypothetical protein